MRRWCQSWALPLASLSLFALLSAAQGCRSYEAAPFDALQALRALERVKPDLPEGATRAGFHSRDGLNADEAAVLAVARNPGLRARRAAIGVSSAELAEAAGLADIEVGWDGMDAAAGLLVDGAAEDVSFLAGAELRWELPRPGERDAQKDAARAALEGTRQEARAAELTLVRDVHLAHLAACAARRRLRLNERLRTIAEGTSRYFERALEAGAATALAASLADAAVAELTVSRVGLEAASAQAMQALNGLLGLPPATELEIQDEEVAPTDGAEARAADALVAEALRRRPDFLGRLAGYQQAEEALRLEVIRQWPKISIGTGIGISLPLLSGWNGRAIRSAWARRLQRRRELEEAVHAIRQEVYAGVTARDRALRSLRAVEGELVPRTRRMLAQTEAAFRAREVTLLEVLAAQRQVIDTETAALDARLDVREARVRLWAACGRPPSRTPPPGAKSRVRADKPTTEKGQR